MVYNDGFIFTNWLLHLPKGWCLGHNQKRLLSEK